MYRVQNSSKEYATPKFMHGMKVFGSWKNKPNFQNCKNFKNIANSFIRTDKDEYSISFEERRYIYDGSLLYLIASRPDFILSVCLCAWHQSSPKESHLKVVKCIFRYLKGTTDLWLWYLNDIHFDLKGILDAEFVGARKIEKPQVANVII